MNLKDIKYWHSICLDTFIITTINIKRANNKNNSENVKTWTGGGDQLSPYHFLQITSRFSQSFIFLLIAVARTRPTSILRSSSPNYNSRLI